MPKDLLIVERRIGYRRWARCRMQQLKKGEVFRLFTPEGERVHDGRYSVYVCSANPEITTFGKRKIWGVDCTSLDGKLGKHRRR